MHTVLQLCGYWAAAFVTLSVALVLLAIFYEVMESDLELHSLGKELAIAAVASLVEAVGVWFVVTVVPNAFGMRALIIPAFIVALLYKISHLEDWSRYEVLGLLAFQLVIVFLGACLVWGQFGTALIGLVVFVGALAVIAALAKGS